MGMRRAGLRTYAVVLLLAAGCGERTVASHEVTHQRNGLQIRLTAERRLGIDVEAVGVPHAFGVLYPSWTDSGVHVLMRIDDRPPVVIAHASEGGVEEVAAAVRVEVSEDRRHVATRHGASWHVFHLLPRGTPFDSPSSRVTTPEVDFGSFGTPEEIARAIMEDPQEAGGSLWELMLAAIAANEPSALDAALVNGWPYVEKHVAIVDARLAHSRPHPDFLSALFEKAKERMEHYDALPELTYRDRQEQAPVVRALVRLGAERTAWLDERRIAEWETIEGELPRRLDSYVVKRCEGREDWEGVEPFVERLRPRVAAAARRWLGEDVRARDLDGPEGHAVACSARWLALYGSVADREWIHDQMLSAWPLPFGPVHDVVIDVARGELGPVGDGWHREARRRAESLPDTDRRRLALLEALP